MNKQIQKQLNTLLVGRTITKVTNNPGSVVLMLDNNEEINIIPGTRGVTEYDAQPVTIYSLGKKRKPVLQTFECPECGITQQHADGSKKHNCHYCANVKMVKKAK
tara:strand:- start:276 stop:590 length:315 start_codon:yes stop_codon:yes gene_type:complete